jgi:hypothetical protein
MKKLILAAFVSLLGTVSYADDITLGEPGYGGTGCPQGTVNTTLTPDKQTLSIIFDQYVAQAGKSVGGSPLSRKSCNLSVPVHVPQGMSVSVLKVDYRGYMFVPKGAMGSFNVEYFLKSFSSNNTGPKYFKDFVGPVDTDYLLSNNLTLNAIVWSACGEDVNLRVNTSVTAKTNSKKDDVYASLDSTDVSAGLIYQLQWQKCKK